MKKQKQPVAIAEECNGKLFLEVGLVGSPLLGFHTIGDYYTVADGVVYYVNNGTFQRTKDTLMQLVCSCECIGEFDPAQRYETKTRHLSFARVKRMLGV